MSWFESISREDIWAENPQKDHTRSNRMGQAQKRSYEVESNWTEAQSQWYNWVMSWFESIFQKGFESWAVSRLESKFWKAFWVVNWFELKLWKAFWVVSRFESNLWKAIWVRSRFESNSRKLFRVVSWFESILESQCEKWVESESKLSETELNWIEQIWVVPMSGQGW